MAAVNDAPEQRSIYLDTKVAAGKDDNVGLSPLRCMPSVDIQAEPDTINSDIITPVLSANRYLCAGVFAIITSCFADSRPTRVLR